MLPILAFTLLPALGLISATPILKRETARLIESGRNPGFCLSVQGGRAAVSAGQVTDGTPVITLGCGLASLWDVSKGSGSVLVSGTNHALDIGLTPGNGGRVKVWSSFPLSTQQTWYLTDDNRIAQTGGNQCLDQGDNGLQTYQCTAGNNNQAWNVHFSTAPPSGFLSDVGAGNTLQDIPGQGQRLHPVGRSDLCMTVANGYAGSNTRVGLTGCFSLTDPFAPLQLFDLPVGSSGLVRVHSSPNLCLDAGDNPANGSGAKIYTCTDGVPQQKWDFTGTVLKTANNQCLDIVKESGPTSEKPYGTSKNMQVWTCSSDGDPYQAFTVSK